MGCNKNFGLVKLGVWILLIGCTIGVTIAAQAANQAMGGQSISAFQVRSSPQGWQCTLLGWHKNLQLPSGEGLRQQGSDLLTVGVQALEEQAPVLRKQITEQLSTLYLTWTKHSKTAETFVKSSIEQWEGEPAKP